MKKFDEFLNERKITKIQAKRFEFTVKEIVERFDGVPDNKYEWMTAWNVETKLGNLRISLHDDTAGSEIYSIFMKFNEPERSKHLDFVNPYSGKWNIHNSDFETTISSLERRLGEVVLDYPNYPFVDEVVQK